MVLGDVIRSMSYNDNKCLCKELYHQFIGDYLNLEYCRKILKISALIAELD